MLGKIIAIRKFFIVSSIESYYLFIHWDISIFYGVKMEDNMPEKLVGLIKDVRLLKGLSEEQLLKFAERCDIKSFKTGKAIIRTGDLTRDLYILISGGCNVEVDVDKYVKHFVVDRLTPGDIFGEMSFLDGKPRLASIVCKKPSKVVMISTQKFKELIKKNPDIGITIMRNLSLIFADKIRETHNKFFKKRDLIS